MQHISCCWISFFSMAKSYTTGQARAIPTMSPLLVNSVTSPRLGFSPSPRAGTAVARHGPIWPGPSGQPWRGFSVFPFGILTETKIEVFFEFKQRWLSTTEVWNRHRDSEIGGSWENNGENLGHESQWIFLRPHNATSLEWFLVRKAEHFQVREWLWFIQFMLTYYNQLIMIRWWSVSYV